MTRWITMALVLVPLLISANVSFAHSIQNPSGIRELVIIDQAVEGKSFFYENVKPGVVVHEIRSESDGLAQMKLILSQYHALDALHVITHGKPGAILLGNQWVTRKTLSQRPLLLTQFNTALNKGGDILFYGCDVAEAGEGQEFLSFVSSNTHADVAGSNNLTGASSKQGDWTFEVAVGDVKTALPFKNNVLNKYHYVLQTTFAGMGASDSGGSGYRSLTDVNLVVENDFTASGSEIYWNDNVASSRTLVIKTDGVDAATVDVSALTVYAYPGSGTGITLDASSTVVFKDSGGSALQTMTLNANKLLAKSVDTDIFSFFDNNTTSPVTGVAQIDFNLVINGCCANANSFSNFTFKDITYSNAVAPSSDPEITSATYDASSNELVVTGLNFAANGAGSDVDVSDLTILGQGNGTRALLTSSDVERDSVTQFTVTLTGADIAAVEALLNTNGTQSADAVVYNIAAADDFIAAVTAGDTSDATGNGITVSNIPDSDGTLTASGAVSEPVGLATTITSTGTAVDVFDFSLTDAGTADGIAMTASEVVVHISGTSTDAQRGNIVWRLNGANVSNVVGSYNSGTQTITFSGLSISVADSTTEVYTVNAYFSDNTGVTEDVTFILSVDGDTDLTIGSSGTQMGATSAVNNSSGGTLDVVATTLTFTTEPAGSVSRSALSTQPVVTAQDAAGNTDVDFTETVTLSEASAGSLTGGSVAAVSGVATFTAVTYNATADQQSFALTANDDDGSGPDLTTDTSNSVTSDVVATELVFGTQPAGSVSGVALTTQPVVIARDGGGVTDTGFTETITLTEASAGSLTGGSIAAVAGVATFTAVNYTATADQQSFTLTADDDDGVGSNLGTVDANSVTSDVVATTLAFTTQPAPLSVLNGVATSFTTVPVVAARDDDGIVDTGYSTNITLSEVNGAGSALLSGTGDADINSATVTLAPTSGVATYTSMQITYTNSGGSNETFNLQATSGALTAASSSQLTGVVPDADASVTAGGTVAEPVAIDTTLDTVGEAIDIFDFTISDGGTADGAATEVSTIRINTSGTIDPSQLTYRLNGADASDVTGSYNSNVITYSGLSISIADGDNETYTVSAYYNDNTGLTEGQTLVLSVDGDTDLTLSSTGTQMGATSAITNSTGSTVDVQATLIAFTTQPAGSVSGSALTTQPVVVARDIFGNTDTGFTETVTLTEASAGSLTGGSVAAVAGVATFTAVNYTATADQQSFTLTANDDDGVGSNLGTVDANSVTSDVVATTLAFTTQPAPLSVLNGVSTSFTTVPVVAARDDDGTVDTGYSTNITLSEVNGAGSALLSGTGDADINSATVTLVPTSGVATYTSMQITYTNSGGSNETFNLQATSGALTAASSSQLTGVVPDADASVTAGGTVAEPVAIDTTLDTVGEAIDIFDFTISDGGTADGAATDVSTIRINTSGTIDPSQLTYRLNGADASDVTGSYNSNVITFSGLSISIADGDNETYTVSAYYNDNTGLTEGQTLVLSVDGDTDLTLSSTGTQMGATSAITNSTGSTVDVLATLIAFTTQPAGSVSGSALTTQPVVVARDIFGNTDTGFTETVTLTEASAGSLTGGSIAAVAGVATFTAVNYTATADQQSFTLTANDDDGVGSNLGTVDANSVTSDVVATELAFATQPNGSVSGVALTTQPVVTARDGNGITDTGFTETITLTEASAGTLTANTAVAVAGVATFTAVNYTASADQQSFTLTADDDAGVGSDIGSVNANALTSDVIATQLVFDTEPAGLIVYDAQAYSLTTVPVVSARDGNNVVDTGYTTSVTIAEINGAGAATLSGTGDSDGSSATVTLTPSAGLVTFTGLQITYTNSGSSAETFNLAVTSGALSAATSSQFTASSANPDGGLTAAGGVSEPVPIAYSVDSVGEAVSLFDFTLSDGGGGDNLAMDVSEVRLTVTGTANDTDRAKITWRLNGADANNVTGAYNSSTDTLTFTGLTISVADGTNEIYTVNGYFNDNTGLTHGTTIILSVDGDTNLTIGGSGTQMAATSPVTNGSGSVITDDVGATVSAVTLPANNTYGTGAELDFTVNYNESVTVNTAGGTPRLTLTIGANTRYATYQSGSGSAALLFRYTVLTGEVDTDGIVLATTLDTNLGTIVDAQNNAASTDLGTLSSLGSVLVDAQAPTVAETIAVATLGNDSTPNVSFSTDEAGTLAVGGSCGSANEGAVSTGTQTITLTQPDNSTGLAGGTYSDCTLSVTDAAGNVSNVATLTAFTLDLTIPTVDINAGQTIDEAATATVSNTELSASDNVSSATAVTYTLASAPSNGTLNNNGNALADSGTFTQDDIDNDLITYVHGGSETTSDSFTFAVSDSSGNVNNNGAGFFTYTITVTGVNDAPIAMADADATNEDNAVMVDILANDSDTDNSINAASVAIVTAPTNGATSINTGTGVITYTPAADFEGNDSFSYTVEDVSGAVSNTAIVSIVVVAQNDAPVAVADMINTNMSTQVSIDVAANDTDIDSGDAPDSATIVVVGSASNGSAVFNGTTNQIDYTPVGGFAGSDSFTYTINDGEGATSNIATVTVNVIDPNELPVAANDSGSTAEDSQIELAVLDNDTDADGSIVVTTVAIMVAPSNGSTVVNATTGAITYTPEADFNGVDTFTYTVQDNDNGTSNAATVTVTVTSVNDAPVLNNDVAVLQEDNSLNINVLGNDTDVDGSVDATSVAIVTAPTQGTATVNTTTGVVTFTPVEDYSGSDSFTYRAVDNLGLASNIATVTITVNAVNDAPLANDDAAEVLTAESVNINLFSNDIDVDGTLDGNSVTVVTPPESGSVVNNNNGTVTYTPSITISGNDTFTYTVDDNTGDSSNIATVDIVITAPTAIAISGTPSTSVEEGQRYSFTPVADVFTGLTATFSIVNAPSWATFDSATGTLSGDVTASDIGTVEGIVISVGDTYTSASLAPFSIIVAPGVDTDSDTISDFQEGIDGTDPDDPTSYFDNTPPELMVPDDIILDARALFTTVSLAELLGLTDDEDTQFMLDLIATDNVDGGACCQPSVTGMDENLLILAAGRHEFEWSATDFMGNRSTATQTVHVRPLVSFSKDKTTVEGTSVRVKVLLNGKAPSYPFTVPYVIDTVNSTTDNSATDGVITSSDHNLSDGTVVFEEGETQAIIQLNTTQDDVSESDEVLVIKLDDRTTNSEDLTQGFDADMYDINSGVKNSYRLTIIERNVAPEVSLRVTQGGGPTIQITQGGGSVTVTATVMDENLGDTHSLNWSQTDGRLVDTDEEELTFTFDPANLSHGRYRIRLTVTDSQGAIDAVMLHVVVVAALPELDAGNDTDGDGVDDLTEGTADTDDDGIPDFLDNIVLPNVVPEAVADTDAFLIECEPGVRCRLGEFALVGNSGGARIDDDDIDEQEDIINDETFIPVGGIFDFEIHELPTLGQQVSVVIPQIAAIPADAVYRKYHDGEWNDFAEDSNNLIHSSAGSLGFCPPPGDESWQAGLVQGFFCVQLTIEDGGANDSDGEVNGSVSDPGVVSVRRESTVSISTSGSGSGGGSVSLLGLLFLFGLMLLVVHNRRRKPAVVSLGVLFLFATTFNSTQVEADTSVLKDILEKSSVDFSSYQLKGSLSKNNFNREINSAGFDITTNTYDVSTTAFRLAYHYEMYEGGSVVFAYTDLGEVKTDFTVTLVDGVDDESLLRNSLEDAHPLTGSGFTLAYRYDYEFKPKLSGFAEVGAFFWDADISTSTAEIRPNHDGGTDLTFSLGGTYLITHNVGVQLSYLFHKLDDQDVRGFGLGVKYRFE